VNQTVDRQPLFWYLNNQAQVQCDLAQRISPFFVCCQLYKKGKSVFFARGKTIEKYVDSSHHGVIHRGLRALRDFALRAAHRLHCGPGLKSLRALPPYG
jgi:hypothetical protein